MAASTPTMEEMFHLMLTLQQTIINGSTATNTRLDSLVERVQAIELAQSLMVYPSQSQPQGLNPMNSGIHDSDAKSRTSSPIPSDQGDKESSVAALSLKHARSLFLAGGSVTNYRLHLVYTVF
jgi:hypothetical protein